MPCRDYHDDHPQEYYGPMLADKAQEIERLKKQIAFAESALCAALNALEHVDSLVETQSPKQGDFYDWVNVEEAGISKKELVKWHKRHKVLDARHREQERLERVKEAALAKLTDEEKRALGI